MFETSSFSHPLRKGWFKIRMGHFCGRTCALNWLQVHSRAALLPMYWLNDTPRARPIWPFGFEQKGCQFCRWKIVGLQILLGYKIKNYAYLAVPSHCTCSVYIYLIIKSCPIGPFLKVITAWFFCNKTSARKSRAPRTKPLLQMEQCYLYSKWNLRARAVCFVHYTTA